MNYIKCFYCDYEMNLLDTSSAQYGYEYYSCDSLYFEIYCPIRYILTGQDIVHCLVFNVNNSNYMFKFIDTGFDNFLKLLTRHLDIQSTFVLDKITKEIALDKIEMIRLLS